MQTPRSSVLTGDRMYLGRTVIAGYPQKSEIFLGYVLASRSFPDRRAEIMDDLIKITPEKAYENPYISYNCIKIVGDKAVVSNGSHTDMIADKLELGYPGRDALVLSLLTADYERDEYNTPRIAAAFDGKELYVGIVMKDKLSVEKILEGESRLVSTYEKTSPEEIKINGRSAEEIAKEIYNLKYEKIICSASTYRKKGGFELAIQ